MSPTPQKHIIRGENLISGTGTHQIAVYDYGDPMSDHVVVCVHGLTRNARDFDLLAEELGRRKRRVLSISMAGRGESSWLQDPADYNYTTYMTDCLKVLDNFHLRQVDWVGTSMGGIIGMLIAHTHPGRIGRLVLNDIGIRLKKEALERIYGYVRSIPPAFPDRTAASDYLKQVFAPFGIADLPVWESFVDHSLLSLADGTLQLACDPAIIEPMRFDTQDFTQIEEVNLADIWHTVLIPTLILRGAESDILDAETVSAMRATNPRASSQVIQGVGHAPSLMVPEQIRLVADWLMATGPKIVGI